MSTHKILVLLNRDAGGGDQLPLEETLQRTLAPAQISYALNSVNAETEITAPLLVATKGEKLRPQLFPHLSIARP